MAQHEFIVFDEQIEFVAGLGSAIFGLLPLMEAIEFSLYIEGNGVYLVHEDEAAIKDFFQKYADDPPDMWPEERKIEAVKDWSEHGHFRYEEVKVSFSSST